MTPKRERFCQEIVAGKSQADAYRAAFCCSKMKAETIHKRASEMMANREVAGRVAELRSPVVDELRYGLKEAMREADEALAVAKAKENAGAMVAAITLRSKLQGLLVEKREHSGPNGGAILYADMTPGDRKARLAELEKKLGRAR